MNRNHLSPSLKLLIFSQLLILCVVVFFPMVTDEAYYIDWARRSDWPSLGFFDHPPMVAWIAALTRVAHHILAARVMVWLSSLISLFFIWKTARVFSPRRAITALVVIAISIGGIASGFLLTPDTGMTLMWSVALHEGVVALRGSPRRWLSAGLATGLGLMSKYTMVLIGPVFLWGLLREGNHQLRTRWPYLGGLVCLSVFAPHLWWQSHNQWVTFKFQFGHGLSITQSIQQGSQLPRALPPTEDSPNMRLRRDLIAALAANTSDDEYIEKPKPDKSKWDRALQYTGDYLGGVAGLWGAFSLLAIYFAAKTRGQILKQSKPDIGDGIGISLVFASALFPLLFFGILSPFTKIEANWPAMHMGALAILIALYWEISPKKLSQVLIVHGILICALGIVLIFPGKFPGARDNRLLKEAKGYQALGQMIEREIKDGYLAVDSYQLLSAIRYYAPLVKVAQWPGITRGSEYTRGHEDDREIERSILSTKEIKLLALNPFPHILPGFEAVAFEGVRVCPDGTVGKFDIHHPVFPCEKGLREWWQTTYRATN